MKRVKYLIILIAVASLSSCGIFKKDCGCPHFGHISRAKQIENAA